MLKITDHALFLGTVADAVAQAHLNSESENLRNRWMNAIAKAAAVIVEDDLRFVHFDHEKQMLYFWSPDSNEIYETTDECQCPAYRQPVPQPCYHRAMRQLVRDYFEYLKMPGQTFQIDFADAVLFDSELTVREKIELLNLSILEGRTELEPQVSALGRFV